MDNNLKQILFLCVARRSDSAIVSFYQTPGAGDASANFLMNVKRVLESPGALQAALHGAALRRPAEAEFACAAVGLLPVFTAHVAHANAHRMG